MVLATSLFAARYDEKAFKTSVQKKLGHKVEVYEETIIEATYLFYSETDEWSKDTWNTAVNKAAELCNNKAAIAAAKTGNFGGKLIKSLIVATEDASKKVGKWVDEKSDEYDKKNKKK